MPQQEQPSVPSAVSGRTTTEQIRSILGLSGIQYMRRWQEMQRIASNVCKEFFALELPWKDLSSEDVAKAREAMEERDSLLQGRPDIAHWLISKHHRSSSYVHRQRLERSSALEPFIGNQSTSTQSVQSESEDAEHTGAKKRFDAVRNQWL